MRDVVAGTFQITYSRSSQNPSQIDFKGGRLSERPFSGVSKPRTLKPLSTVKFGSLLNLSFICCVYDIFLSSMD